MHSEEFLHAYLKICQRTWEKLIRDGACLWDVEPDSQKSEDLVESEDNSSTA